MDFLLPKASWVSILTTKGGAHAEIGRPQPPPLLAVAYILHKQRLTSGTGPRKKMLVYDVGSGNVYENKGSIDKMPDEKSDILGNVKPILQKISHLYRLFLPNFAFRGVFGADVQGQ